MKEQLDLKKQKIKKHRESMKGILHFLEQGDPAYKRQMEKIAEQIYESERIMQKVYDAALCLRGLEEVMDDIRNYQDYFVEDINESF